MVYFFIVYPTQKHEKYLKRHTMAYVELINQVQSSRADCIDSAIIRKKMIVDAVEYTRRCKACQIHADFIHQLPELLHPTVAS